MLFVGTSIIHPSTEGVFLLCNILDLLIYSYKSKMTQEYLYPYISKTYKALVFIYVWNMNDEVIEKALAWKLHATFWRDKTPFKNSRKNFYKENKEGKLQNLLANFKYKKDIDSIVKKIETLLNCG